MQEIRNELSDLQALYKMAELKNKELQQELDKLNNGGKELIEDEEYSQSFLRMQLCLGLRFQERIKNFKFKLEILNNGTNDDTNTIFKEIVECTDITSLLHGSLDVEQKRVWLEEIIRVLSGYSLKENDSILQ